MLRVWIASLSMATIWVAGCDGCGDERPSPPPVRRGQDMVEAPDAAVVDAMWKHASQGLTVADASPGEIAYALPSCTLRYELRAHYLVEIAVGREPATVDAHADVALTRGEGEDSALASAQLLSASKALTHQGVRNEQAIDASGWARSDLKSDGRRFTEALGPTTLWTSHTSLPPLSAFFPVIPLGADVGSKAKWPIATYKQAVTAEIERARAWPDASVSVPPPEQVVADLMLARWISLEKDQARDRAAVIEASWRVERHDLEPIETKRVERWFGRFVITESGRLLHAAMVANTWHWWSQEDDRSGEKLGVSEQELRLVEACDGVVLQRSPKP